MATTATFTFSANETGSTFRCSLDGAAFAACTSPHQVSGLSVGNHQMRIRAQDVAGNFEPAPGAVHTGPSPRRRPTAVRRPRYSATADAWMEQSSPGSNKGTDSTLKVQSKSGNQNFRALVRFGLPAAPPAGCMVQSATLRVFSNSATSNGRTLRALRVTAAWNEGTVTWGNQPGTTGAFAATPSGLGWREWNVDVAAAGAVRRRGPARVPDS